MKTILKISVLLNVMLLGGAVFLWMHPRTVTIPAPVTPSLAAKIEPQTAPAPIVQTVVAPFRWSQLMPTNDYHGFVANLRAAGCPEATVEDIVRGNTSRAYAMMREQLRVDENQPGPWSEQAQEQMVAYFLGRTPNVVQAPGVAEASAAPAAAGRNNPAIGSPQTGSVTLASFLQNVDLTTPGMSSEQQQEVGALRQNLLAQISSAGQAANRQGNPSSQSGADTTPSPSRADDNSPSQTGSDGAQPAQNGSGPQRQYSPAALAALQNAGAASALGGLFGMGAAIQYELGPQGQ